MICMPSGWVLSIVGLPVFMGTEPVCCWQVCSLLSINRGNTKLWWGTGGFLGTQTLHRVINCTKESEMEKTPSEWDNIYIGYEVHNWLYSLCANVEPDELFPTNIMEDPTNLDEVIKLAKPVVIPAFHSTIVKELMDETTLAGYCLHVMTKAPYPEDEAYLPVRLYILHNYTQMKDSSWTVYFVLRNGTSQPICLSGGQLIRQVTVNLIPEAKALLELMKELGAEDNKLKEPKLTMPEWQACLI